MSSHIWILIYTLFVVVIQIQALYEGLRKKRRQVIKPDLHATPSLIFVSLFGLFVVRWFLFFIACILLPNLFTIITACILFVSRLWVFLIDAFDHDGNAKQLSPARNTFSTVVGVFETAFVVYFLIAYFLI
ncbi:hypothetical protein SAMN05443507_11711 [Alicyclobacillus tolerans]|uniref:Uncharacterized protein n=1 Tax=Alicyclobacillus tolerans TaxID=90970 RepID=A0A1M6TLJ7_9BACL|nr:hypothetical protein SAMN05443507_11711 [Alicyclobacillus montanus]